MSVYVKPEEIIDVFYDEILGTAETKMLAEAREDGIEIFMYDDGNYPKVIVMCDGYTVDVLTLDEPAECVDTMKEVYGTYIYGEENIDSSEPVYRDDLIKEREQELEDAAIDFLSVVFEENINKTETEAKSYIQDFVDYVLEYLYRKQGVDVYRPMILVDENNEEFFEEYPYSCMEFD